MNGIHKKKCWVRKVRKEMNYTQREKLTNDLCGVGLMLIFVEIMYQVVNSSYMEFNYNLNNVTKWVFIGGGVMLALAIGILIYAYGKKSGSKACYGMELLVFSITFALLPGCYLYFTRPFTEMRRIFPIVFLIYYIGKVVYIIKHAKDIKGRKTNQKKR